MFYFVFLGSENVAMKPKKYRPFFPGVTEQPSKRSYLDARG